MATPGAWLGHIAQEYTRAKQPPLVVIDLGGIVVVIRMRRGHVKVSSGKLASPRTIKSCGLLLRRKE
jgi:hypothetical protein